MCRHILRRPPDACPAANDANQRNIGDSLLF
jgi:hypothetical protein